MQLQSPDPIKSSLGVAALSLLRLMQLTNVNHTFIMRLLQVLCCSPPPRKSYFSIMVDPM